MNHPSSESGKSKIARSLVGPDVAKQIKAAAMAEGGMPEPPAAQLPAAGLKFAARPGVERWSVKTGTDADVNKVGKNVINTVALEPGIVSTTVEELVRIPRSADMTPPTQEFPAFQNKRKEPAETTVWQIEADVIALKLEADGDYHLVLQGASGETMIGEIPTPRAPFVAASSPWLENLKTARQAVDDKLVSKLSPADFVALDDPHSTSRTLVPQKSLSAQPQTRPPVPASFSPSTEDGAQPMPAFKAKVAATPARITGVGFFDRVHDQTGVALSNGIELHPILEIEWL
jgi:hypothetical protein